MSGQPPDADDPEVLAEGRRFALVLDADGVSIMERLSGVLVPVRSFGSSEDDLDEAWHEYTRLSRLAVIDRGLPALAVIAAVSGLVWVVARSGSAIAFLSGSGGFAGDQRIYSWLSTADSIANVLFFAAVGLYVVGWLEIRSRRRGG